MNNSIFKKKEKHIDYIETILTVIVFVSIMHYMFKQYEKYYMISYFLLPFLLKIISNIVKQKENFNKKIIQLINFIILAYFILMYILTMSIPAFDNFLKVTDQILFPFFYYKEVKFTALILIFWIPLGWIKNKLISMLLQIAIFFGMLLLYNLW